MYIFTNDAIQYSHTEMRYIRHFMTLPLKYFKRSHYLRTEYNLVQEILLFIASFIFIGG